MYQEQIRYQKEVEKEAKRLGVPEGCISLYGFGSSCVAYDYAGTPEERFAKFYNFDWLCCIIPTIKKQLSCHGCF